MDAAPTRNEETRDEEVLDVAMDGRTGIARHTDVDRIVRPARAAEMIVAQEQIVRLAVGRRTTLEGDTCVDAMPAGAMIVHVTA